MNGRVKLPRGNTEGLVSDLKATDTQIQSVASLGKMLRRFAEVRIDCRNYLLAQNPAEQEEAAKHKKKTKTEPQ